MLRNFLKFKLPESRPSLSTRCEEVLDLGQVKFHCELEVGHSSSCFRSNQCGSAEWSNGHIGSVRVIDSTAQTDDPKER